MARNKNLKGKIVNAIAKAPKGSTLKGIINSLYVSHQTVYNYLKQYPELKQLFDSLHSREVIVNEAIKSVRKNANALEIAENLGMTNDALYAYFQRHPKSRDIYKSLHCNIERKMKKSTLERITKAIINTPKGTTITKLQEKCGVSRISYHFKKYPELKNLYLKIHGEINEGGRPKNFEKYIEISEAIKNAKRGSYKNDIANSIKMDTSTFKGYMQRVPCLKILYNSFHGKPAPKQKGILQERYCKTIEKMENPTISKIARALNIDKSAVYQRFKRYPLLKKVYDMKRK